MKNGTARSIAQRQEKWLARYGGTLERPHAASGGNSAMRVPGSLQTAVAASGGWEARMKVEKWEAAEIVDQGKELDVQLLPLWPLIQEHGRARIAGLIRSGWLDLEFIWTPGHRNNNFFVRSDQLERGLEVPIDDA